MADDQIHLAVRWVIDSSAPGLAEKSTGLVKLMWRPALVNFLQKPFSFETLQAALDEVGVEGSKS